MPRRIGPPGDPRTPRHAMPRHEKEVGRQISTHQKKHPGTAKYKGPSPRGGAESRLRVHKGYTGGKSLITKPASGVAKVASKAAGKGFLRSLAGKAFLPLGAAMGAISIGKAAKAGIGALKARAHGQLHKSGLKYTKRATAGGTRAMPGAKAPKAGVALSRAPKSASVNQRPSTPNRGASSKAIKQGKVVTAGAAAAPKVGVAMSSAPKNKSVTQGHKWKSASKIPGKYTSFEKAFSAARREGARHGKASSTVFSYKGKKYTTKYKGE